MRHDGYHAKDALNGREVSREKCVFSAAKKVGGRIAIMQGMRIVRRPLVSAHLAHKAHLAALTPRYCAQLQFAERTLRRMGVVQHPPTPARRGRRTGRRGVSKAPLDKARRQECALHEHSCDT